MTAKTPANDDAKLLASFVAAPNAAEAARIIGKNEKGFRDGLRSHGWREQKGTGWTTMTPEQRASFFPGAEKMTREGTPAVK